MYDMPIYGNPTTDYAHVWRSDTVLALQEMADRQREHMAERSLELRACEEGIHKAQLDRDGAMQMMDAENQGLKASPYDHIWV